jgi:hypothetical protein
MGHGLEGLEGCCLINEAPFAHTVAKGALVAVSLRRRQTLMPVCALVDADVDYVPVTFQVRDNTVFFSNVFPQIAELLEELNERRNIATNTDPAGPSLAASLVWSGRRYRIPAG